MTMMRNDQAAPETGVAASPWAAVRRRDRALVAACLAGDEAAWCELWQRYGPLVKAVARRAGCDDEEARAGRPGGGGGAVPGRGRPNPPPTRGGGRAALARFQARDVVRQRRPSEELLETTALATGDQHEELARAQAQAGVHQALLAVDERCRRLIVRLDLKEPTDTYAAVAADEGLATSSLGPIRRRCLERLRKILEQVSR